MVKRKIGFLVGPFVLALAFGLSLGAVAEKYSGGSGSSDHPYRISTAADLIKLSITPEDWDKHFKQTADITFNSDETLVDWDGDGSASWDAEDQKGLASIGNSFDSFQGSYDGQNHTITNLYIHRTESSDNDDVGLFGEIAGVTIENLGLIDVSISGSGYYRLGALVGWITGSDDTVENCYSTGTIDVTDSSDVGGLVGSNYGAITGSYSGVSLSADIVDGGFHLGSLSGLVGWNSGTVTRSHFTGTVNITGLAGSVEDLSGVGGLVGNGSGSVDSSYSSGDVDAESCIYVGGLMGANNGSVNDSYFTGTITGDNVGPVGGLAGVSSGSVSNSYSTGSVNISNPAGGYENFGGLVGRNGSSTGYGTTLDNSYSTGAVTVSNSNGANVGGLVGENYSSATLNDSYSMASVTINNGDADDNVGGLVGENYWKSTVNRSYSTGAVTSDVAGNVGGLVGNNYDDNCIVNNSFWDTETSGQDNSDGGSGKTTAEMNDACTFISVGWSFAPSGSTAGGTWTIDEASAYNSGYPALAWQEMGNSYGPCAPGVQTKEPGDITTSSATFNGEVFTDGGAQITTRGFCWSTSPGPTTSDSYTADVSGTDLFSADVTGLSPETTYYVRAYAENEIGTAYGNEVSFSTAPGYSGGSGTESDPYIIATTSDLIALSNFSGHWDKHFKQIANLSFDADETKVDWNADGSPGPAAGFSPIGNSDTQFTGTYDGGDHNITDLYIDRPGESNIGLFGYTGQSTIEGLGVIDVAITGNSFVGGLVGRNSSAVIDCYGTGSVNGGQSAVGGLVGANENTVSNSYSRAFVEGSRYSGGLVGYNYANGTVSKSYSTGEVSGSVYIGGLVGGNHFIATMSDSYSTASVVGNFVVGGLLGVNDGKGPYRGTVENCYSTGEVSGSRFYGGLIGVNEGAVNNSFWNVETSDQTTSGGGVGKTTEEMKDFSTFEDIWDIEKVESNKEDYPYLTWEDDSDETVWRQKQNDNAPPTAKDDTVETDEDTSVTIDVLTNDTDSDGSIESSTVTVTSGPSHGSTSLNTSTGEVTYSPDKDYHGADSFTYTVKDEDDETSNEATVEVEVKDVNDPPTADFNYSPSNPTSFDMIQFTDKSTDSDGSVASWNWDFGDGGSSSTENPSHSYDEPGTYSITLTVTDDDRATESAAKEITVGFNTKKGKNVEVTFEEDRYNCEGLKGITFTYEEIVSPGETTVTTHENLPFSLPQGIRFLNCFYRASTTAKYTGTILVKVIYGDTDLTENQQKNLREFKLLGGKEYVDLTVDSNYLINLVTGNTDELSYFGLGYGAGTVPDGDIVNHGPNPAGRDGVIFWFELPPTARGGKLIIYDVDGRPLLNVDITSGQTRYPEVGRWNLRDANGNLLGNGIYLYRLTLEMGGSTSCSDVGKLVIDRTD